MRVAFAVIIGVLAFYVYKWWLGTKSNYVPDPSMTKETEFVPPEEDKPPSGSGVTMYGSDSCPWCTKQKDYFTEKGTESTRSWTVLRASAPTLSLAFRPSWLTVRLRLVTRRSKSPRGRAASPWTSDLG